jgi:hypothetical protein
LRLAVAEIRDMWMSPGATPAHPLDAREGRRLAETVRSLAADREELRTRVTALEQEFVGVTGSIARIERVARDAVRPVSPPSPAHAEAAPNSTAPEDVTASITSFHPAPSVPVPVPSPGSHAPKTEYGLDLGNATSVEALRTAWTAALRRHGALLQGLSPVVQTRDRPRSGKAELRLIAGPIASAAAAARLCAAMTAAGAVCAPTTFEGQRLAVR